MWVTSLMDPCDLDLHAAPDGTKRGYRARGRDAPELSPRSCARYVAAVPAGPARSWQSRHCAATLVVWVPRHPSRRGTLLLVHLTRPGLHQGEQLGRGRSGVSPRGGNPPPAVVSRAQAFERIRASRATRRGRGGRRGDRDRAVKYFGTIHASRAACRRGLCAKRLRRRHGSAHRPVSLCVSTTSRLAIGARARRGPGLARPTIVRSSPTAAY